MRDASVTVLESRAGEPRIMLGDREAFLDILDSAGAIVFDFDNVLADSEPHHFRAYNAVFSKHGHRLDEDEYWVEWTSKGIGAVGEIERYKLDIDPDDIIRGKVPLFTRYCRDGSIRFFAGALELVSLLREAGLPLSIASGSSVSDIGFILEREGLSDTFAVIHGKESTKRRKPSPDIFLLTAEKLGVEPGRCLVIEDAEKGVIAAREAGIPCAVVRTRVTSQIEFRDVDFLFDSLDELVDVVREWRR